MLLGGSNTGVNIAMAKVAAVKKVPPFSIGPGGASLTNEDCTAYSVHYVYDTVALANGTATAIVNNGGKTWFYLTADYAFGTQLQAAASKVVETHGGKNLGAVRVPLGAADFSSFLLQAQASKAKVVGMANAGADAINTIKQAHEFGLTQGGQVLAGLLIFSSDVKALGLETAQGLVLTEAFYWDQNDATRAFSRRFAEKFNGKMPTSSQAGVYSSILHYLKAVAAAKTKDSDAVMAKMKELPIDDALFGQGKVRADGRAIHNMYLYQVKTPAESKGEWDLYKVLATIPAEEAFRPMDKGDCPLVAK
jgi:branched-chain amino acid transport system substrate-binding protein